MSRQAWQRLGRMLDPTNEVGAAWGVKERLRAGAPHPDLDN
jgi:hypothetical protein